MKNRLWTIFLFLFMVEILISSSAFAEWDSISESEKSLSTNPIDPGAGAIVLFKRGKISVVERSSGFWTTEIDTYVRIKILNESGKESANVSFEAVKNVRLSKVEGRTVLPSGQVILLDPSQVFRGRAIETGKHYTVLKTSFALPSVEPGAIVEYHTVENIDWYFFSPWIFDDWGLATLKSTLTVQVGPRLAIGQFPLETTLKKIQNKTSRTARGMQFDYEVDNLFPVRTEPYSIPFRDQSAMVIFTPYAIEFGNDVYPIIQKWNDVATEINHESVDTEADPKIPSLGVFNHVIVAVPVGEKLKDAVVGMPAYDEGKQILWIDPTSSTHQIGELPEMDQGVHALIDHDGNGEIESTPEIPADHNGVEYHVKLLLQAGGKGAADVEVRYLGESNASRRAFHRERSQSELRKYMESQIARYAHQTQLTQMAVDGTEINSDTITENYSFTGEFASASTGNIWFFQPLFLTGMLGSEIGNRARVHPLEWGPP